MSGKAAWKLRVPTSASVQRESWDGRRNLPTDNKQLSLIKCTPRKCMLQLRGEPNREAAHRNVASGVTRDPTDLCQNLHERDQLTSVQAAASHSAKCIAFADDVVDASVDSEDLRLVCDLHVSRSW